MLERPDLQDQLIISGVQNAYGLRLAQVTFLPLGADVNTAVYRLVAQDETAYFLKLRKGVFDEITVAVPKFLNAQAIPAVIAPLETRDGRLWASLDAYVMILYPFIQGRNGYETALSERHWTELGAALKGVHMAQLPPALERLIPCETYSPQWRESVKTFQTQVEHSYFDDPVAAKLAVFMKAKQAEITHLVERAGQLGRALQARSPELVLCHCDIHLGNLLIGDNEAGAERPLYIVDWDNPMYAPKERDLMFVGAGMGCAWPGGREEALFYRGYNPAFGQTGVDRAALAYYRYERIIQDISEFCKQLFLTTGGGEDREQSYQYFTGQFLPNHEVDVACNYVFSNAIGEKSVSRS
jgi:spectinomycin phosphotransferase